MLHCAGLRPTKAGGPVPQRHHERVYSAWHHSHPFALRETGLRDPHVPLADILDGTAHPHTVFRRDTFFDQDEERKGAVNFDGDSGEVTALAG